MPECDGKCLNSEIVKKLSRIILDLRQEIPGVNGTRSGWDKINGAVFEITVTKALTLRQKTKLFKKIGERFFGFRITNPRFAVKKNK